MVISSNIPISNKNQTPAPVPIEPVSKLGPSSITENSEKFIKTEILAVIGDETDENKLLIPGDHELKPELPEGGDGQLYSNWNESSLEIQVSSVEESRDTWTSRIEFIMVNITTAVGIGNVWRFPITAYENGGGAFLIMYFIVVFTVAKPLYLLELSLGQLGTCGPIRSWNMVPGLRGVGVASLVICALTTTYLSGILAISCVYIAYGFSSVLPWSRCYWNSKTNSSTSDYYKTEGHSVFNHLTCNETETFAVYFNPNNNVTFRLSNSELFYSYTVKEQQSSTENGLGRPVWKLVVGLYVVWLIVFLNAMLGLKSSGKAAYFTALFPYFVLITLFIKALTLPGALEGIVDFLIPHEKSFWNTFLDMHVWYEAVAHCYFSFSIGYGIIIVFGSYNPIHKKVWTDVSIIGLVDCVTSVLSSMTIFAMLGNLAKLRDLTIKDLRDVSRGGPGLAFVSYPQLVLYFEGSWTPQIFSFLFFLMLLTLGIGFETSSITTVTERIFERFQVTSGSNLYRAFVTAGVCLPLSVISIIYTCTGGNKMIKIVDYYLVLAAYVVVTIEIIGISWIYGMKSFVNDVRFIFRDEVQQRKCRFLLEMFQVWGYVVPVLLISVLITAFSEYKILKYQVRHKHKVPIPPYSRALGWIVFSVILSVIPIVAIRIYFTRKPGSHFKKLMACLTPNKDWGPRNIIDKIEWTVFKRTRDETTWIWKNTFGKLFAEILESRRHSTTHSSRRSSQSALLKVTSMNTVKHVVVSSKDAEKRSPRNSGPPPQANS